MNSLRRFGAWLDNPSIPWKPLIIAFAAFEWLLEEYFSHRQYQVLKRKTVPVQLKEEIDQSTFDKSQAYGRAKAKYGFWKSAYSILKNYAVITYDILPIAWNLSSWTLKTYAPKWMPAGEIATSLLFIFGFQIVETIR